MYDYEDDLISPSPAEIRRMCLEFQRTWTDFERAYRAGLIFYESEFGWTVPQYLVHHGEIGRSHERRYRELRVWERVG